MEQEFSDRLNIVCDKLFDGNKAEMARHFGKSPQSMYQYFNGTRNPGKEILHQLITSGVNLNWFFTGEGEMELSDAGGVINFNQVNEVAAQYQVAWHHLENSIISDQDKIELIKEFQKSIFLAQNEAVLSDIIKKRPS